MPAAVRTMSSSRIIRRGGEPQRTYILGPLGTAVLSQEQTVFRPVQLGFEEEPASAESEAEVPPPPPSIPEEEAHRLIEEARAEGEKEGRRQAELELAKAGEAMSQALIATGALRGQLLHEAEEDLLKLAVQIARKIMLREFTGEPAVFLGLVRGAVDLAADMGEVVVKLNPEDFAIVSGCSEFKDLLEEKRGITLKGDAAVGRAGCMVESVRGNIEAGLDAQLEEIFRLLTEEKIARREEPDDD